MAETKCKCGIEIIQGRSGKWWHVGIPACNDASPSARVEDNAPARVEPKNEVCECGDKIWPSSDGKYYVHANGINAGSPWCPKWPHGHARPRSAAQPVEGPRRKVQLSGDPLIDATLRRLNQDDCEFVPTSVERAERVTADRTADTIPDPLEVRRALWLGHGHTKIYGDDGEMQCNECPIWDYRRAPFLEIVAQAHRSLLVNAQVAHAARTEAETRIEVLEAVIEAHERIDANKYVEWGYAGTGVAKECSHGYAKFLACPLCDLETIKAYRAALAAPSGGTK